MATLHALHPEGLDQALIGCGAWAVKAEEGTGGNVQIQQRGVLQRDLADAIKHFDGQLQRSHEALVRCDLFDDDLETPKHLLKWLAHLCMDDSAVHGQ